MQKEQSMKYIVMMLWVLVAYCMDECCEHMRSMILHVISFLVKKK